MKRFLVFFFVALLAIFLAVVVFILAVSKPIPEGTEEIMDEVFSQALPEQILGDTGRAKSNNIAIWYESIKPPIPSKGTILLIMGLGGNSLEWPLYFVKPLVDSGYHVIRFDNRSTGLSTWTEGDFSLEDMKDDALAVMDELNVDKAHVFGMSMGGMIGQLMAVQHPEKVESLTSFMASAYIDDPELPSVSKSAYFSLMATGIRHGIIKSEKNIVRTTVSVRSVLAPELSSTRIRSLAEQSLYNQRFRKGFNPKAFIQHTKAVMHSGSRYEDLKKSSVPHLVIHGKQDPLIPVEHTIKMAQLTPDAQSLLIEGMGHDVSPEHIEIIHKALLDFIE